MAAFGQAIEEVSSTSLEIVRRTPKFNEKSEWELDALHYLVERAGMRTRLRS